MIRKIKLLWLAIGSACVTALPVFGEPAAKINEPQDISTSAIPGEKTESTLFLSAGGGLAMYGGNIGWALNFGALTQLGENRNLFYGLDAGLNFWSFQSATAPVAQVSSGATAIQVLPTLLYRFEIANPSFFPFVGASLGPNLYLEKQTISGASDTRANVFFEMLIRPGFFAKLGDSVSLQVEAKFGVLRSSFIFLPQANAVFSL